MITDLAHVAVATATLTVGPDSDGFEWRIEIVDVRSDEVVVSLPAASARELGRRITAQARVALRR